MLHVYHAPLLALLVFAGAAISAAGALIPSWLAARGTTMQVLQTE
jgi:hypothetical protein